jgi:hypothetical protein
MRGTRSVGITLLFWLAGALYTVAGAHLYIEFGLSTPRHFFKGVKQGIPRSGGTLNYVGAELVYDIKSSLLTARSYNMSSPGPLIAHEPSFSLHVSSLPHTLFLETWRGTL